MPHSTYILVNLVNLRTWKFYHVFFSWQWYLWLWLANFSHVTSKCVEKHISVCREVDNKQESQLASCRAVFCAGFNGVSWTPHAVHVKTMWCQCRNYVVSTCKPSSVHMETTWSLHGNHMVSMLKPCVVHMKTIWHHLISMWTQCGYHVDTLWFQGEYHMVSRWTLLG